MTLRIESTNASQPTTSPSDGGVDSNDNVDENDDGSSEFLSECKRQGIPLDLAQMAVRQSSLVQGKWRKEMQADVDDSEKKNGEGDHDVDDLSSLNRLASRTAARSSPAPHFVNLLELAKSEVLTSLESSHGDTKNPRFSSALKALSCMYHGGGFSVRDPSERVLLEGTWDTISKPIYKDCIGTNSKGDFMYTLGRMSFDMFRPTNLRCSIQKVVCKTRVMDGKEEVVPREVPRSLRKEVAGVETTEDQTILKTYDIEVHFSIEPKLNNKNHSIDPVQEDQEQETYRSPSRPLKAIMTNFGYLLPDPENPIRFTVWFTGGVVAPMRNDEEPTRGRPSRLEPSSLSRLIETCSDLPTCPLPLHECRRKKKPCAVHGAMRPTRSKLEAFIRMESRYMRPRFGMGCEAGRTNPFLKGPSSLPKPFSSEWEDIFAPEETWRRSLGEQTTALAAKLLLGAELPDRMDDDGTMAFTLNRPIGGHGTTYIDVLYLDKDMRILRGNAGSIFVQVHTGRRPTGQQQLMHASTRIGASRQTKTRHSTGRSSKAMAA